MGAFRRVKQQEVPFFIDGRRIIKTVTKKTTCGDVINKLPNLDVPLAVFETVDGTEKELSSKAKLLKIWRAHDASSKVEFVIKKSQKLVKQKTIKVSSDSKCPVSKWLEHTRRQYLSTRVPEQAPDRASLINHEDMNRRIVDHKLKQTYADEEIMDSLHTSHCSLQQKTFIFARMKSNRFGLKQIFAPKSKTERTTSTGTINSTDTGYHSVGSEYESEATADDRRYSSSGKRMSLPNSHTLALQDTLGEPRHSTPVFAGRTQTRLCGVLNSKLTTENVGNLNDIMGKTMLLQKFMDDQTTSRNSAGDSDTMKRRNGRFSLSAFSKQEDVCRFIWFQTCDSDTDSESDHSELCDDLDLAFNAGVNITVDNSETRRNKLRRVSAISNLNELSLLSDDAWQENYDIFNYSLDCSFPRMEDSLSDDLSYDYSLDSYLSDSDSYSSDSDLEVADYNQDDDMDSFMNTRSFNGSICDTSLC